MRTLKYAILGLLNKTSMTGYELTQHFESTLSEFWSAKHSQIYPELKRLAEEGMVEFKIEISGVVLEKKVYTITKSGKQEFMKWLAKDEESEKTPKDVFRLRLFFSSGIEPEIRIQLLNSQLMQHQLRLIQLKNNQKKHNGIPKKNSDEFGDYLILLGAIMREEMNCEWLEKCIELCEKVD